MTRIRCTQALLKILRIKPDETQDSLTSTPLGDWYAHLLWIERKKCILFTNEVTLFNFLALDVKKADLTDMNTFFRENLRRGLEAVGIIDAPASRLLLTLGNITISKTNNRSVLGSMNDYAFQFGVYVETQGGLHYCDILEMKNMLNNFRLLSMFVYYHLRLRLVIQDIYRLNSPGL